MKNFKRVLTACMLVVMLASLFALTSCFGGGVEGTLEDLIDADSYTMVRESGERKETVKYDSDTLTVYICSDYNGTKTETYYYQDEDAGKYYKAWSLVVGSTTTVKRDELTVGQFIEAVGSYGSVGSVGSFVDTLDLWTETENGYEYSTKDEKTTIELDENDALVITMMEIEESKTSVQYKITCSDINDTEIEVPENFRTAKLSD